MVVLCAEDDVYVQYSIWKALRAAGITVLTAGNGQFALDASRRHPGPIDLLITDMEMPLMHGLELSRNIRAERPSTKILVMSSNVREREMIAVNELPFVQKPLTRASLLDSVEALLGPIPALPGTHARAF